MTMLVFYFARKWLAAGTTTTTNENTNTHKRRKNSLVLLMWSGHLFTYNCCFEKEKRKGSRFDQPFVCCLVYGPFVSHSFQTLFLIQFFLLLDTSSWMLLILCHLHHLFTAPCFSRLFLIFPPPFCDGLSSPSINTFFPSENLISLNIRLCI